MPKSKREKIKKIFMKGEKQGITLIALVITIIVLLILAGVSIATLMGDNGILTKAQTAKEETQKASEEEQIQLAQLNATMNTQGYNYETEDGKTVPIPAGFAPTQIEGENSIEDGFVITDSEGNEFVWIPCDVNDDTALEETADGKVNYNAKRDDDWKAKQYYYNGGTWGDGQPNKTEIQNSIKTNKGFYIARYEAGIPSNAPFYASKDKDKYYTVAKTAEEGEELTEEDKITKNTSAYKPVSKRGVQAWNYITQKNAKDVAESMISNNGVHSYLIDSHAWDTTCRVIAKSKYDKTKSLMNSTTWGNYYNNDKTKYENLNTLYARHEFNNGFWTSIGPYKKGKVTGAPKGEGSSRLELSTGASEDFKAYNIYDLAGNMWEWTTENGTKATTDNGGADIPTIDTTDLSGANAVCRGGSFHDSGSSRTVVYSDGSDSATTGCHVSVGFRVVLYLQSKSNE